MRVLGHPLHAALAHLPIGLLAGVAVWDALALLRPEPIWWAVGFWSLALGVAATLPAMATGLMDYAGLPRDSTAQRAAFLHLCAALAATGCYAASLLLRAGPAPPVPGRALAAVVTGYTGLSFLAATGWLGAELIFRHGIGLGTGDELERSRADELERGRADEPEPSSGG